MRRRSRSGRASRRSRWSPAVRQRPPPANLRDPQKRPVRGPIRKFECAARNHRLPSTNLAGGSDGSGRRSHHRASTKRPLRGPGGVAGGRSIPLDAALLGAGEIPIPPVVDCPQVVARLIDLDFPLAVVPGLIAKRRWHFWASSNVTPVPAPPSLLRTSAVRAPVRLRTLRHRSYGAQRRSQPLSARASWTGTAKFRAAAQCIGMFPSGEAPGDLLARPQPERRGSSAR